MSTESRLAQLERKMRNIRGPGVSHSPEGITIRTVAAVQPSTPRRSKRRIIVRVSGNSRDGTNWRWTYSFVQVEKTAAGFGGWTDKSGGLTGTNTLRNLIEDQNGTTAGGGVLGNGVDVDNLSGLTPQPIPTGTRIEIWPVAVAGTTEYWCQYENGIDGTCA